MPEPPHDVALVQLILHELRTPLNILSGSLGQLTEGRGGPLSASQLAIAERAHRAAAQLDRLGDQLREWVAVRSQPARHAGTALEPALAAATDLAEAHAGRGLRIEVAPLPRDVHVRMTPSLLEMTLRAIVDAVSRGAANGAIVPVSVRTGIKGSPSADVRVLVLVGEISETNPDGPFTAESVGGLGFSLPLARAAVESSGGRIWSRSAERRVLGIGIALPV